DPDPSGRVGLVGAAVSDYPDIDPLVAALRERDRRITVSSLRADSLTEGLLRGLAESGARTITIAPEAGSERLRKTINKRLDEETLRCAVEAIGRWRFQQLKLYFMVGLPGEGEEDLAEIPRLTRDLKRCLEGQGAGTRIVVNLGPFVPKAHTPFEREPLLPVVEMKARLRQVRRALLAQGVEAPVESAEWAEVQAVLARGDRRLAGVLAAMDGPSLAGWRSAMAEAGLKPSDPPWGNPGDGQRPWCVVDTGVRRAYLEKEIRQTARGRDTMPCPPSGCVACGVCPPVRRGRKG
ncbi:MAG: radical SAM protein, partial [Chloroflexi bacterium]|nr:radical SAM protein [Chloroflexota bacterium]